MAIVSGYRWRAGTWGAGVVLPVTYAIENFPRQTDMGNYIHWMRPGNEADFIAPAAIMQALDGSQDDYGGVQFTWEFSYWSPDMANYVFTTMFSSEYDAATTVRTWNRVTGLWEEYTATALWPTSEQLRDLDTIGRGWRNFPIRFIKGTKIA